VIALLAAAALAASVRQLYFTSGAVFSAVVEPASRVVLNFPNLGPLAAMFVGPGQNVRRGEVLAQQSITAAVSSVASDHAVLAADRQRLSALARGVPATPATLAEAHAQISRDLATLSAAQSQLNSLRLVSPINGLVVAVGGTVGDLVGSQGVSAGADPAVQVPTSPSSAFFPPAPSSNISSSSPQNPPLLTIDSLGSWVVVAQVPEGDIARVTRARRARVTIDPLGGRPLVAHLRRIVPSPVLVGGSTYYDAVFVLARSRAGLLPGMTANLVIGR